MCSRFIMEIRIISSESNDGEICGGANGKFQSSKWSREQSFERDIKQDLFYHGKTLICVILGCFFSPKATSWIHMR